MSNPTEVAEHLASVFRTVGSVPPPAPLDETTWKAAFLAAAEIVKEDAATRRTVR